MSAVAPLVAPATIMPSPGVWPPLGGRLLVLQNGGTTPGGCGTGPAAIASGAAPAKSNAVIPAPSARRFPEIRNALSLCLPLDRAKAGPPGASWSGSGHPAIVSRVTVRPLSAGSCRFLPLWAHSRPRACDGSVVGSDGARRLHAALAATGCRVHRQRDDRARGRRGEGALEEALDADGIARQVSRRALIENLRAVHEDGEGIARLDRVVDRSRRGGRERA